MKLSDISIVICRPLFEIHLTLEDDAHVGAILTDLLFVVPQMPESITNL